MYAFEVGVTNRRRKAHRWHQYCIALLTILAFGTLLAVSGPHLVHHLTALSLHERPHAHNGPQTRDHHAPPHPDCLVLFLMQHTPVAEEEGVLLPTLLLA